MLRNNLKLDLTKISSKSNIQQNDNKPKVKKLTVCPSCGHKDESKPKYCSKCKKRLWSIC